MCIRDRPDSPLYALVGKGKPLLALVNDKNAVKVCFGFHKAGLDCVAQTVLGGLVNHIEWLMRCHVGERLAVGTSGEMCIRDRSNIGGLVNEAPHMDRQPPAVHIVRFFAEQIEQLGVAPVSYTHLDVYKRQQ